MDEVSPTALNGLRDVSARQASELLSVLGRDRLNAAGATVGSGTIKVKVPRVSDVPESQAQFESRLVSPYQKRSRTLSEVFPKLFIEGLATRDFEPALRCLMGAEAALSPSTISRLNAGFKAEYEEWTKSSLSTLPIV